MGKGNRNNQKRVANANLNTVETKNKNTKKGSGKAVAVACIAFAVLIVAVLLLNVLTETGLFIRATQAMELNGVVVDGAMLSFFYNDYIMSWYNNYYSYLSYMNISFSASLKLQDFPKGSIASYLLGEEYEGTWYDYFLDKVVDNVEMYITFCDAANKENIKLDSEDYKSIDENVQYILDSVKASGSTLADWFGRGVTEGDVRRCYEIITLANKYSEHKYDKLEEELKAEEDAGKGTIADYIEKNKGDFYTAEYLSYDIKISGKNYTDEQFAEKVAAAMAEAQKIADAGNVEAFLNLVKQYEAENNIVEETTTKKPTTTTETDDVSDTTETETETEKSIEEQADEYRETIAYETETGTEDCLENWIFLEGASEGDGHVFVEEGTETVKATTSTKKEATTEAETGKTEDKKSYKVTTVTAYLITKPAHLSETLTKNFAFAIGNNKADIEKIHDQFNASSDKTIDKFNELAEAYYNKLVEDHEKEHETAGKHDEPVFVYNKAEKAFSNFFKDNYFGVDNKVDEWIEGDPAAGSLSLIFTVTVEKETYYAVVFLESRDWAEYYVTAFDAVVNDRFNDWYEKDSGKGAIEYNQFALDSINTIVMY